MKTLFFSHSLCMILIITTTNVVLSKEIINMYQYQTELYPYRGDNRLWGYNNFNGMQVIKPRYDLAGSFQEGLASVKKKDKWGYINENGKEIIPLQFEVAAPFSGGLAAVKKDGKWGYINANGIKEIDFTFDMANSFSEGLAAIKKIEKWGYIDTKGKNIIENKFDVADNFSEGIAGVEVGGKWGYIDTSGKEVISPQFDLANPFSELLASVEIDGKWGYINRKGTFDIPAQYDTANPFSEGLASVSVQNKDSSGTRMSSSFIDKSGEHILAYSNATAESFHSGRAILISDNTAYLINKTGEKIKQIGQNRVKVQLDSDPNNATVYMIPLYEWEVKGAEELLKNRRILSERRVPEGKTPVTTTGERIQYMIVFCLENKKDYFKLDVFPGLPNKAKGYLK